MTEIYYFSGTGNSLIIAKKLSVLFKGKYTSIPSIINMERITSSADTIGIVFPVYNHLYPYIVERFVNKLDGFEKKYIFAVCNFGGAAGLSLLKFKKILSESNLLLKGGFGIKMPYNYIFPSFKIKGFFRSFKLNPPTDKVQKELFEECENRIYEIYEYVKEKKEGDIEKDSVFIENALDFLNLRNTIQKKSWLKISGYKGKTDLSMLRAVQLFDYGFHVDENCIGCETCRKICPVNNIQMKDKKPIWLHNCEQCFACLQWCPQNSIQFRDGTRSGKRYHHPEVKLSDMMN